MRLLFIGEGRHDIGDPNPDPYQPRPAQGTIPTLARRVCPGSARLNRVVAWEALAFFP